jgi:peptide deformylase
VYPRVVGPYALRIFGDPVLRQRAREVDVLDGGLAHLVEVMTQTMYDEHGVGLAAPQIGIQQRLYTYDIGDGPRALINPEIVESSGESVFEEGCLSVPGVRFDVVRPQRVTVRGIDVDGNEVVVEDDDYLARVMQHEIDHLDGVLLLDRLEPTERKAAMRELRHLLERGLVPSGDGERRL